MFNVKFHITKNTSSHTHTHTHLYIYIYICVCVCVYFNKCSYICSVSKRFGEWYHKTNKTEDSNKLTLLAFKIIAILQNLMLATFIKLLETVSGGFFRNLSQNRCHTFLDCRRVCKTCAFHDALQAGKEKEVRRRHLAEDGDYFEGQ
jgi:hypothetical protein